MDVIVALVVNRIGRGCVYEGVEAGTLTRGDFLLLWAPLPGAASRLRVEETRLFAVVNRERVRRGLPALVWSVRLGNVARKHSLHMARGRFFSHVDPQRGDLVSRLERDGVRYTACAENIYRQSSGRDAVVSAGAAWMKSAGHRANLLNGVYRESGIGAAVTDSGECFVTQIFLA